jgi:hypothetical protein
MIAIAGGDISHSLHGGRYDEQSKKKHPVPFGVSCSSLGAHFILAKIRFDLRSILFDIESFSISP